MTDLTERERRAVARFIADVWRHELKRHGRRPTADQTMVAAYGTAMGIIDAEIGDRYRFLGAPGHLRAALVEVSSGAAQISLHLSETALNVIGFLDAEGDHPTGKPTSIATDRRVLALAAADYHRHGEINRSAIGRKVGLSHTSINDRLTARAARTMARLRDAAPDIWSANARPTAEPAADGGKVWRAAA